MSQIAIHRALRWLALAGLGLSSLSCTDTVVTPGEILTDPAVMPTVIYTSPQKNSIGPYNNFSATITVRFNKLMDQASLQHAIHFYSPSGDLRPDTGTFSINQGDVASITPIRTNLAVPFSWRVRQVYTLRIDATARDINGNALSPPFEMTFEPEPYFRVKSTSPASGAVNVSTGSILVAFNAPVDTSIYSRITVSPPVNGLWHYQKFSSLVPDSSQVIFQNSSSFGAGRTYTISIGSGALDKNGDSLRGGFASSFSTTPFGVTGTSPGDGATNWPPSQRSVGITWSDMLDTSTVRGAIHIDPPLAAQFLYYSNYRTLILQSPTDLDTGTVYRVVIDTSIRSKSGARMFQSYAFTFLTGNATSGSTTTLQVVYSYPFNGDSTVPPAEAIRIYFNSVIDTATARHAFGIAPPIDGLLSFPGNNEMVFSPIRTFELSTSYTVSVAASIASATGDHLASPYIFSFRTLPFKITYTSPYDGETHVPSVISRLYFEASDVIDTSTVRRSFGITPSLSGIFSMSPDENYFEFYPSTSLQPFTIYTVTISDSLRSRSGMALESPHSISFATGD
jgi:hypothetical protein